MAPSPIRIRLEPYLSGLSQPLLATNAKDGTRRLFVVQQGGIIKVVQPGATTATDFLNISSRVVAGGEQGLLGLAFHPQFATNGYFFVNYTRSGDGATVIARYKTTSSANTLGDPASERILLVIPQPFSNHNGGMIEFRTDNGVHNLYIGMGDGGSANDPGNRAQNINDLLGKFLRITPDVSGSPTAPAYTVPADNPYVGVDGADEIYAIGVRNPFRWSFDRGGTRQLWAGDVGQGSREEVDIITLGGNYGWRILEGNICTPGVNPNCTPPAGYIPPVLDYSSATPSPRCSVTGGYVYRGTRAALPGGSYIYGDYCTGEIFVWNNNQQALLLDTTRNISSFGEDEDGELYVVGLGGTVERIARFDEANADFDGDGKTDLSVFRPSAGAWYILNSANGSVRGLQFGADGDIPTPEDYDGDNLTDISVFRPSNGVWYRINSSTNTFSGVQFGQSGDVPVAGDYDGDARADIAVFRPSNGTWYRQNSGNNTFFGVQFGVADDTPVPADYDGDGKIDITVFRRANGVWYRINSGNGSLFGVAFGDGNQFDSPAVGDYDGDGRADIAVQRQSGNSVFWYILRSSDNAVQTVQFGTLGDLQAIGDYNGDGRDDIAVFRRSNVTWYTSTDPSTNFGARQFGQNGDLPVPAYDRP
jgi:glucose/arabinose dehydrogenase